MVVFFQLVFEVVNRGYPGDIALDDMNLQPCTGNTVFLRTLSLSSIMNFILLCANRNKSRLLFSSSMVNSVDSDQTAPIEAVCSGSTLFDSILNSSVMLGNYLQQTTSADDIFRCIFFLGALRVNKVFI